MQHRRINFSFPSVWAGLSRLSFSVLRGQSECCHWPVAYTLPQPHLAVAESYNRVSRVRGRLNLVPSDSGPPSSRTDCLVVFCMLVVQYKYRPHRNYIKNFVLDDREHLLVTQG